MKIIGMTNGKSRLILLDTGGLAPQPLELALFLCRSITMLGEYYLAGPTATGEYLALNSEGVQVPRGPGHLDFLQHPEDYRPMDLPPLRELLALGQG